MSKDVLGAFSMTSRASLGLVQSKFFRRPLVLSRAPNFDPWPVTRPDLTRKFGSGQTVDPIWSDPKFLQKLLSRQILLRSEWFYCHWIRLNETNLMTVESFRSEQYSSRYCKFTDLSNSRPVWPVLTSYPTRPEASGRVRQLTRPDPTCEELYL